MRRATIGSTPSAMAVRTMKSMCPSSSRSAGWRSSVQKQIRWWLSGVTSGSSVFRLRALVASRMKIVIPRRSFSRASSTDVHSWSEWIPAAT